MSLRALLVIALFFVGACKKDEPKGSPDPEPKGAAGAEAKPGEAKPTEAAAKPAEGNFTADAPGFTIAIPDGYTPVNGGNPEPEGGEWSYEWDPPAEGGVFIEVRARKHDPDELIPYGEFAEEFAKDTSKGTILETKELEGGAKLLAWEHKDHQGNQRHRVDVTIVGKTNEYQCSINAAADNPDQIKVARDVCSSLRALK